MKNLFNYIKNCPVIYTHGATFHSDDVFAIAMIKLINPSVRVIRTFNLTHTDGLYIDIGLGEYDHHQANAKWRPDNSTKYCAFGLLFKDLCTDWLGVEVANFIDKQLVVVIDKADNGVETNMISNTISKMNLSWEEERTSEAEEIAFNKAVDFATNILKTFIKTATSTIKAKKEYNNAERICDGKVIILNRFIPFNEYIEEEILYVIYPHLRGGYALQATNKSIDTMECKAPLPITWRGKPKEELVKMVEGLTFCHASGFLSNFITKETAIKAVSNIIGNITKQGGLL